MQCVIIIIYRTTRDGIYSILILLHNEKWIQLFLFFFCFLNKNGDEWFELKKKRAVVPDCSLLICHSRLAWRSFKRFRCVYILSRLPISRRRIYTHNSIGHWHTHPRKGFIYRKGDREATFDDAAVTLLDSILNVGRLLFPSQCSLSNGLETGEKEEWKVSPCFIYFRNSIHI